MQTIPNETLLPQTAAFQTEIPPETIWLILGVGLVLAGGWFYIQATNCWNKPVAKAPMWCLTAPIFGLR